MTERLRQFILESNRIEGIIRPVTGGELANYERLLALPNVFATSLGDFQSVVALDNPIRQFLGMNVHVGNYVAPPGGPNIIKRLQDICTQASRGEDPWKTHVRFELLHPYMGGNGRTGRALWLWQMQTLGRDPFQYPFLQHWYYATLENAAPKDKNGGPK